MHGIHCILCVFMKAKQIDTYDVGIIIEQSPNRYVNVPSLCLFVRPLMMVINYARYTLWIIRGGGVKND